MKLFKKFKPEVLEKWHSFIDVFEMSPMKFYELVEKELQARKIPGLTLSRVKWEEGGLLSANREYLRLTREKWVFDICAAPFGVGYFFSYRFTELPIKIHPLALLAAVIVLPFICFGLARLLTGAFGIIIGIMILPALLVFGIWFLRNVRELGFPDLDSMLLQIPGVSGLYECFRKDSYYREDTRLMYLATVPTIVKKITEEVTASEGVKLPDRFEGKPILKELSGVL